MIQNLHTHTERCGHAVGRDEEYVLAAIEGGLEILGFSEHSPHIYPGGYISNSHMQPEQLEDYTQSVRSYMDQYKDRLTIYLGSEIEFYPALFHNSVQRLLDAGIEYLILGQHWIDNEVGHTYLARPFDDPEILKKYCRQVLDGMQTGLFTYLCHPDVVNFTGNSKLYEQLMRQLCREANGCGLPIEYNLWGIFKKGCYPADRFWRIAAEENCRVVLGVDAHKPEILANKVLFEQGENYIKKLGMELLERCPIKRIQ